MGWVGGLAQDDFVSVELSSMFLRSNHTKTLLKHVASTMVLVMHACSMSLSSKSFLMSIIIQVALSGRVGGLVIVFFPFFSFEIDVRSCKTIL